MCIRDRRNKEGRPPSQDAALRIFQSEKPRTSSKYLGTDLNPLVEGRGWGFDSFCNQYKFKCKGKTQSSTEFMNIFSKNFGNIIQRGWSQEFLAERTELSRGT